MRRRIIAGLLAINLIIGLPVTDIYAGQSIVQVQTDTDASVSDTQQTTNVIKNEKSEDSEETKNADGTDKAGNQRNGELTETDKNAADSTEKDKTEETKDTETVEPEEEVPATEQIETTETAETSEEPELALFALNVNGYPDIAECFGAKYNADNKTVQIENRMDFIMLSNCDPAIVADLTINVSATAANSLLNLEKEDGDEYEFRGIGDEANPFHGTLNSTGINKIQVNQTFFGGLRSDASIGNAIKIVWDGDGSVPMLAGTYVMDGAGECKLPKNLSIESAEADTVKMGGLIGTVKCADTTAPGTLVLGSFVSYKNVAVNVSNGNAGLICNTLESGTIRLEAGALPSTAWSVSGSGDAGGLIGHMNAGTNLELAIADGSADNLTVTSTAGNAGGAAGVIEDGAALILKSNFTFSNLNVNGAASGGGVAGITSNEAVQAEGDSKLSLTAPTVKAKGAGSSAGGFYGIYIVTNANANKLPECIRVQNVNVAVIGGNYSIDNGGNAGGIFGKLCLNTASYTIAFNNVDSGEAFQSTWSDTSVQGENYGAIAGQVVSSAITNTLTVRNVRVESAYVSGDNRTRFQGGLIGKLGGSAGEAAYLEVSNVNVKCTQPYAKNPMGFGGLVGCVAEGSILKMTDNVKIVTTSDIFEGGSVVGYACAGSAVEFSGTTDTSEVRFRLYNNSAHFAGQLVGAQENALIYARGDGNGNGWTFNRSTTAYKINDIGNYGEILRLKDANGTAATGLSTDLITITADHKVTLKAPSATYGGNEISIASVDDFALLAIAWNSQGYFSADAGNINSQTWMNLFAKNITLAADINLTGTGIIGFTRDNRIADNEQYAYSGILDGGTHKITLAIGETFGRRNNAAASGDGSGQLYPFTHYYESRLKYCHTELGLFAQVNGSVKNLTIDGIINFGTYASWGNVGGIAGRTYRTSVQVSGVRAEETITLMQASNGKTAYIGGFFGENNVSSVTIDQTSYAGAAIWLNNVASGAGDDVHAGGMIGTSRVNVTIDCNSAAVGGSITSDSTENLYCGGMIATIQNGGTVNIGNLSVDGLVIAAEKTNGTCGGFLGYSWNNVQVKFATNSTEYALKVNNAKINAPNANVGGLVYTSTGKSRWTVNDKGINLSGAQITAGNGKALGLLVCHGESLYLEFTEHWSNAYELSGISLTTTAGIFDELVAYTASSAADIMKNNENGIVSLATEQRVGVNTGTECTTYVNRTTYGRGKTNGCSRYYYDLDKKIETVKAATKDGWIDTPEELLIWSVYQYATGNLKDYFKFGDSGDVQYNIGGASADKPADLNMKGLSYYPTNLSVGNVTVQNAKITFYNETIEKAERSNKSTVGNQDMHTQHYAMHGGLFHDQDNGEMTVNVKNVTFSGSIGKVADDASGVLFSGSVGGGKTDNVLHIYTMNLEQITLDGLTVYNIGDTKAPMLLNQLGSYVTVAVDTVNAKNYASSGQKAASSLIGDVGAGDGTQISISFSNIALPDKTTDEGGIFTKATLLNSFQYADDGVAVGTYNFYHKDDYAGNTHDHHNVTYGAEITDASDDTSAGTKGTKEYKTLQQWYYDETLHGKEEGIVKDKDGSTDFRAYLPYVAVAYNTGNHTHELKINQRVSNLTEGCGTYGHPYVITKASELIILAEYLAGGENAKPRKDWVVTITSDQNQLCSSANRLDVSYQYNGTNWVQVKQNSGEWVEASPRVTLANAVMYRYLLSAYYDIQGEADTAGGYELTLNNFKGLGNTVYPFRGVITSSNGTTVKLLGSETANGFIPYSYGSVIKDISFAYQTQDGNGKALAYQNASTYYPQTCFGGVIGCIMGGDNIIDNVSVTMSEGWLTLTGEKKYLLQVGGFVGSVCGGGVIFRNMDGKSGLTDNMISGGSVAENATGSLYVNPYVGRVLDGFAFSEGCKVENTNKNYKINPLDTIDIGVLTTTGGEKGSRTYCFKTEIKDAQGLLILSALINSGAAAGSSDVENSSSYGGTYAYWGVSYQGQNSSKDTTYKLGNGIYGKVRNASYNHIGEPALAESDFKKAKKDDQTAPGCSSNQSGKNAETLNGDITNAPYLVTKYCNKATFYIAGYNRSVGFIMNSQADYDMKGYGNGYQGISARYSSNALNSQNPNKDRIVPWVTYFKGENRTLKVDMSVKEYGQDDFCAVSAGGIYNLIQVNPVDLNGVNVLENLTIADSSISIRYYDETGAEVTEIGKIEQGYAYEAVGVGGFAGNNASNMVADTNNASYKFQNVNIKDSSFISPGGAGGLMGNAGKMNWNNKFTKLFGSNNVVFGVNLIDCTYSGLTVNGRCAAGGFVGSVNSSSAVKSSVQFTTAGEHVVDGTKPSTVTASSLWYGKSYAGGIFGDVRTKFYMNENDTGELVLEHTTVSSENTTGGVTGYVGNEYKIIHTTFRGTQSAFATMDGSSLVGGIVGESAANGNIENCKVNYTKINSTKGTVGSVGGIVGNISGGTSSVKNCTVEHFNANGNWTGGIVGSTNAATTITGCEVLGENTTNQIGLQGEYSVGGILGFVQSTNLVKVEQCKVDNASIHATTNSNTYAGGFIANMNKSNNNINLFDSMIQNSSVQAGYVGGMVGIMHGTLNGSNLLFSNTSINGGDKGKGLLIGFVNDGLKNVYLSGVSLQKGAGTTYISDLCGNSDQLKGKGYIAFADYDGAAMTAGNADSTAGTEKDLLGVTPVSPYVTTSPKSSLSVKKGYDYLLYGDSASWASEAQSFTLKAEKIWNERTSASNTKYVYSKTGVSEFNFSENVSTYNDMQPEHADTDFPVLLVTSENAEKVIADYLDIVTNGGYSEANTLRQVTAGAEVYSYDSTQKKFVYDSTASAALQIDKNQNGSIVFHAPIGYDNNRNRFTLLTVTFGTVAGHQYKVQVPLIVRRMLQVDFTATLNYGTHFKSTDYDNLTGHVLESFGNSVTAYLTYTYNSEKGTYADYGWKNYVEAGGDATKVLEKQIIFAQDDDLPAGTQLTLVDCQDNNRRMYSYTITDADAKTKSISLSSFTNTDGTAFASRSIGEVMGVQAEENAAGTFLETNKEGMPTDTEVTGAVSGVLPTVKIGEKYYRLAQSGETGGKRYKVTIAEENLSEAGKSKIKENYYLVITMPESAVGKANGAIQTDFESREIPYQINYELRGGGVDKQENTVSTYQISSGYQQKLKDNSNLNQKELIEADRTLKICITDEITFPKGQAYQIGDQLYLRFIGSLQNWITENESQKVASAEFPAGTEGQVHFYIYTVDGDKRTYYSAAQSGSTIKWSTGSAKTPVTADGYLWTSDGGNMELPLSSDGSVANAISLQGVRDSILQNSGGDKTTGTFYVEAVLDAELPSVGLDVIPQTQLSSDGSTPIDYAKITYTSQLSAEKISLSYSNMKKTLQGDTKYYRQETDSAVLTYDADDVNQLGINPYDLGQNVDASKEHALIDTTAVYDLAEMRDLENTLLQSGGIRFTLKVLQKDSAADRTEKYGAQIAGENIDAEGSILNDADQYLTVKLTGEENPELTYQNGIWSWTIPQSSYVENHVIKTGSSFDGTEFMQAVQLQVKVNNIESAKHSYSNYKVVVEAEILDAQGNAINATTSEDYLIYTLAKIRPEFVE